MLYDSQVLPAMLSPRLSRGVVVGVLALQGAFREHTRAAEATGAAAVEVRTPEQLARVDALVIPGGESTVMRRLLVSAGLYEPLGTRLEEGMAVLGTCAGMIVLAHAHPDGAPAAYGVLDVDVVRNGYGRQPHSFEAPVELRTGRSGDARITGVFIRAPRIAAVGERGGAVEVIGRLASGTHADEPVAVRQGNVIACTFHPELVGSVVLHELLVSTAAATIGA